MARVGRASLEPGPGCACGAVMPVGDSGKDPVVAMVSVNVPIWGRRYGAAEREARSRLGAVLKQREEKANMLVSRLEMAVYGVEDAERKIALYRDTILPQAKQAMEVTRQAFTADSADFLDLIDSQRTLLQVQLECAFLEPGACLGVGITEGRSMNTSLWGCPEFGELFEVIFKSRFVDS